MFLENVQELKKKLNKKIELLFSPQLLKTISPFEDTEKKVSTMSCTVMSFFFTDKFSPEEVIAPQSRHLHGILAWALWSPV